MTLPGQAIRAAGAAVFGVLIATCALAQAPLQIFDAHLHYNQEPNPFYDLDKVLETFRRNNVTGIIATSRPNKGTHQLVDAKAPGLTVVPFIRPYRTRSDIQTWFDDPAIWDLIQSEYKRGYYRGIGEGHIYGKAAAGEQVKRIVNFAVEKDLWLHMHCDEEALLLLFGHNPKVRIIWAHTGFSTAPARVRELMDKYPALMGELSYRGGITEERQAVGGLARAVRQPLEPLPARLRHLDQRALVRLRRNHEDLSRVARAIAAGSGAPHRARKCRATFRRQGRIARRYFLFASLTCSAMKRGNAKAATCTSGVQYRVLKLPAFL